MIGSVILESYAMLALSCIIAIPILKFSSYGLIVQSSICIAFSFVLLAAPIYIVCFSNKKFNYLKVKETKKKFGILYEELEIVRGRKVFLQPFFFLLRRLTLAFAVTVTSEILIAQIYLVVAQSLIALIILEYVKPLKSTAAHKNEIFNEVVMILILYTFISFTDWVPSLEAKFKLGYLSCGLIVLHLLINIFIMLTSSIKGAYKACRLSRHRRKHNKKREILQKRL